MAVFEEALKLFASYSPGVGEVADVLPFIRSDTSPHNEAYVRGRKDGDLYMGWEAAASGAAGPPMRPRGSARAGPRAP
jgi:hypothetical protein